MTTMIVRYENVYLLLLYFYYKGEEELQSWYSAVATTKPSPNPWLKANYRLNYRYACMLPTMLELPVSESEKVRIEEYCYSEVCTVYNDVMNSTTIYGKIIG